jgi:hypothetical protein
MRVAACDPDAFYPLRSLVAGTFDNLGDLPAIERFVRTVVLHDEIVMELTPWSFEPEVDFGFDEEELGAGGRNVITAIGPILDGYDFFTDRTGPAPPVPEIELTPALVRVASQHANAGEGNVYFEAHVEYLKRVLGIVEQGGSVLLCSGFGQQAVTTARRFPEDLFRQLDEDWRGYAQKVEQDGLKLLVPPVLAIVLTRCVRRDAIPTVIRDLRDEWAAARRKVWELLDALRNCPTLGEALEIRKELSEASRLFSPVTADVDTRPIRVLWEILAATAAGATTASLSGGNPVIGAATNMIGQVARSFPALAHEFGSTIFGRGAFDLARRVRRATGQVEFDALPRLLTDAEKQKLGFR